MSAKSVNRNTAFNTIKSVMAVLYPLITSPYVFRVLLTDNMGKLNFGNSVVSYVSLVASLGVTTYAIRECSKVRENKEDLSIVSSQIFSINILSTLIAYLGLAVVLIFAKSLESYRLLICIQSTTVLFATLGADWINTAMEDFRFIAIRTVLMQVLSLVLLFVFVHRPEDYMKYALICVVAASGANIINIFYRKKFCSIRFTWNMDLKKHLPRILLLFSLILSQTIYVNSDMTILGLIKGDHETGLYGTSVKIYTIVNSTISSIAWVVIPQLTIYFSEKNYKEINKLLKYALNFIIVLGIPCVCGLEIIAPQLIVTFAGEDYADAALSLRILGVALFCSFIGGWIGNMTRIPAGGEKISLVISSVCAAINLILNLILIPIWGLNAAAFTTAVSELVGLIWGFIIIDRNIKIDGIIKMIRGPIFGCIGIFLIGGVVQHFIKTPGIVVLLTVLPSVLLYFFILMITKNEFLLGFVTPVMNKLRRNH